MKPIFNGLLVLCLLMSANVLAAGLFLAFGSALQRTPLADSWPAWYAAAILSVAAAIAALIGFVRFIGRWQPRDRARAPD